MKTSKSSYVRSLSGWRELQADKERMENGGSPLFGPPLQFRGAQKRLGWIPRRGAAGGAGGAHTRWVRRVGARLD